MLRVQKGLYRKLLAMCYFVYFITFILTIASKNIFTYLIDTYNEFREVNPLKASAAISVILLLLKFLEKKINMTISNTSHNHIVLQIINLSAREFMSPL